MVFGDLESDLEFTRLGALGRSSSTTTWQQVPAPQSKSAAVEGEWCCFTVRFPATGDRCNSLFFDWSLAGAASLSLREAIFFGDDDSFSLCLISKLDCLVGMVAGSLSKLDWRRGRLGRLVSCDFRCSSFCSYWW